MTEHTLTLLHLSDLHERASERASWRRRRVLGKAWEANLDKLREDGPYDLVCFTGDAAFAGQGEEYEKATDFFGTVLDRLGLGWDRFFPIPGNHDINRKIAKPTWRRWRENLPRVSRPEMASWLAGGWAPLGFKDRERTQVLERQAAYQHWVREDLGRPDLEPSNSPHGLLGYRKTLRLPGKPFALHILGLDSAWFCGDDNDAGKLWLTDEQVMRLATNPEGELLDGFRLALVHHPLEDLADGSDARRLLAERVDLVLRGHLHEPDAQSWADPERSLRQVAAGCLYEHDRYPNACERLRIVLDENGRPLRHEVRFRGWSSRGFWFDDDSLYSETVGGRLTLWIKGKVEAPMAGARPAPGSAGESPEQPKLGRPLMTETSLSVTRTTHVLPFQRLSPADFERLCLALIHREGYEQLEHLGAAGRDDGQDIVAYRNSRRVVFQCKRCEKLGPKDAEAVVSKIRSLPEHARPEELILIATCLVSSEARERARVKAGGIDFQVWALTELDALVQRHPDLLSQFFDLRYASDLNARGQSSKQIKRFAGIDPEGPEPNYPDEATRTLAEALKAAYRHKKEIAIAGDDTQAIDKQILDLRRQLREGGRLKAGDCLAEGRYLLNEALGRGGFATVWKAYDENDHRLVAVKVLHGQFGEDRTELERFFRGARKMRELNHPGIVRVLESRLDDGGYHFFVMEYVAGGDLRQAILEKRVGSEESLLLLRKVSIALQFAHEKGFIHRDVKPANILLDTRGQPKLTDFDLVLGSDTTGGTLMGAGMMGTFLYSAPEVMSEPSEARAAADVYSLAMTAAFCLLGKDLPIDVLRDTEAFLQRLPCSSRTRAAIKKAIALQPEDRFSSVVEFAEALDPAGQSSSMIDESKEEPLDRSFFFKGRSILEQSHMA